MPKEEIKITSADAFLNDLDVFLLQLREAARSGAWQLVATNRDDGTRLYQIEIHPRPVPVAEPSPEPQDKPARKPRKATE